jgi:CRP/FNR family cyclic AMP-dependent transcriptional regulator
MDVTEPHRRTVVDLCQRTGRHEPSQGTQMRVSRQELARIVGCSREMAGRVLKQLEEQTACCTARGKTIVVYRDKP